MAVSPGASGNYLRREPHPSGLADVLNVILDKGLVVDVYLRVAVVGIELLTVDARVVIASVDTYLRFAEAVNRLDIIAASPEQTLPELMEDLRGEGSGRRVTRGAIEGAKDTLRGE
jgi:gas vesicle structural protein